MKKCPYCAEEIQDAAVVCRHCGRELGPLPQGLAAEYEYSDFVYNWPENNKKWTYVSPGQTSEPAIRLAAWQDAQKAIAEKLEPMVNQGWEYMGEFGPSSISIEWESMTDSITHFFYSVPGREYRKASATQRMGSLFSCRLLGLCLVFAILIIVTAGIALIPMLIYFGIMRYAAPTKFQMRLRRRIQSKQSV
jgi:hypothetical protein